MTILLHDRHIPHAYNLICRLPEFHFTVPKWNGQFRPLPKNAIHNPQVSPQSSFDAIIEDDPELPYGKVPCGTRIFLQHTEIDAGNPKQISDLLRVFGWAEKVVVVSDHRRASMREHGIGSDIHVIELDFNTHEWLPFAHSPDVDPRNVLIGTWHNSMNSEQIEFFRAVCGGFEHLIIGSGNEGHGFTTVSPYNWHQMRLEASRLSVFVNPVVGEAFGYSPMEAMAMELPVVTGSMPEAWNLCFDSWNCFISRDAPLRSVDWMRERIKRLIDDPTERKRMGQAASSSVSDYFKRLNTKEKWLKILR